MSRRGVRWVAGVVAIVVVAGTAVVAVSEIRDASRQQAVAERGAQMMPFDLDATTHRFDPAADGGVQSVVADDPSDADQIELIQQHLQEEAEAFARGEFSDPAQIHGADMPGLAMLEDNADRFSIRYRSRSDGAEVRFTTAEAALVAALHDWFAAQTSDHGGHAG